MHPSSLAKVIAAGGDINERDEKGRTAAFRAARGGKRDNLGLLLAAGADPNALDLHGEAPLQAAVRYGHIECARCLIASGACLDHCPDPSLTRYSESALCTAIRKRQLHIVELLLDLGASPNRGTSARHYPLLEAAEQGDADSIRRLVACGADLEIRSVMAETALIIAARCHHDDSVKALLELGANVNAVDQDGMTVLHAAMFEGRASTPMVIALVAAKPDLSLRDLTFGETALECAQRIELDEVIRILQGD